MGSVWCVLQKHRISLPSFVKEFSLKSFLTEGRFPQLDKFFHVKELVELRLKTNGEM